jgi:hypothetical protein
MKKLMVLAATVLALAAAPAYGAGNPAEGRS